jgi:fatty-acid desaturase
MSKNLVQIDAARDVAALPGETDGSCKRGIDRVAAIWAVGVHLLALLVFVPWFFSWIGVVLLVAGIYLFGMIGINLGFHRLLAHRSFACPRWVEHVIALLGVCSAQGAPGWWVAVHRMHHHFADNDEDPHAPGGHFFWGHLGWITYQTEDMRQGRVTKRYARDLLRDPLYAWLETHWQLVAVASWLPLPAAGLVGGLLAGMSTPGAVQLAASIFVWGVAARTVYVWHVSAFVNSASHLWGYRSYETNDNSRNNLFVGYFAHGEGWHNNHHADPQAAMQGRRAWEFDPVFWAIRLLARLGLATDIVMPKSLPKSLPKPLPKPLPPVARVKTAAVEMRGSV